MEHTVKKQQSAWLVLLEALKNAKPVEYKGKDESYRKAK